MAAGSVARWAARLAIAVFVVALVLAGINRPASLGIPFHVILALVLLAFAGLKFSVAIDSWQRLRAGAAASPSPVDTHGAPGMVVGWVVYKMAAGVVALAAAIFVCTLGAARVDQVFGG